MHINHSNTNISDIINANGHHTETRTSLHLNEVMLPLSAGKCQKYFLQTKTKLYNVKWKWV